MQHSYATHTMTVPSSGTLGNPISPLDGRYYGITKDLRSFFSENAYVSYRRNVELKYFYFLASFLPELKELKQQGIKITKLDWYGFNTQLSEEDYVKFEKIQEILHHDVKSIEYITKDYIEDTLQLSKWLTPTRAKQCLEFVHFGLTSEDINSTAMALMVRDSMYFISDQIGILGPSILHLATLCKIPALAFTHGQPATPILLNDVFETYHYRICEEHKYGMNSIFSCKFGGATGNMVAHSIAYPNIDWSKKLTEFIEGLGLSREKYTTQISNFDNLANICNHMKQMCVILKDMCIDIWLYISKDYFIQTKPAGAVGSSTMPHKTNPIKFENAEGNLKLAIHWFEFFAKELPVSRLHRDLTGSTMIRNIGCPFAHMLIGITSIVKGLKTITPNKEVIEMDLHNHWEVITEAYQTILRKEGYEKPYEALKTLSDQKLNQEILHTFVDELDVPSDVKQYMKTITPNNYYAERNYSPVFFHKYVEDS